MSGTSWMERPRDLALALAISMGVILASWSASAQVTVNTEAQAQVRFARGRELFLARDYASALTEFRAANALVSSPNTRLYIARCLREMGHLAEAYLEFQRAASEAADRAVSEPRYLPTRDSARAEAAAIEPRLGRLVIRVPHPPPGITVRVGGTVVPSAGWDVPTPVDPGSVEVTATAPGWRPFQQTLEVRPGRVMEVTVEMELEPVARPSPSTSATQGTTVQTSGESGGDESRNTHRSGEAQPSRTAHAPQDASTDTHSTARRTTTGGTVRSVGFGVMAVGMLGSVGVVTFGVLAQNRYDELRARCGQGPCDPSWVPLIDEGERFALLANVSLGVGIAGLVAGTLMIALGGPTEQVSSPAAGPIARVVGVQVTPVSNHGGMLQLRGMF